MSTIHEIAECIMRKEAQRCRIGWVDFAPGSWDWREATARAIRIQFRRAGERITLQRARQL